MIKGAKGQEPQDVKVKGMAEHHFVGAVGKGLKMRGQMSEFSMKQDSVMLTMNTKGGAFKGHAH